MVQAPASFSVPPKIVHRNASTTVSGIGIAIALAALFIIVVLFLVSVSVARSVRL